jgi:hypothetical protein
MFNDAKGNDGVECSIRKRKRTAIANDKTTRISIRLLPKPRQTPYVETNGVKALRHHH